MANKTKVDNDFDSKAVFDTSALDGQSFNLAVTMGFKDGYSKVDKFGVNHNVTTSSDPEDMWEFGGLYNYDTDGTAPIQYLSSSNTNDNQTITVQGLDINGDFVSQNIALSGQLVAPLITPLWRVFRMVNDNSTTIQGVVYCHTDPAPTAGVPADENVRAIINDGNNQTLMTLYTIPKGKVAFLHRGEVGLSLEGNAGSLAEYAHIHYESRRFGKVFTVKKSITVMVGGISVYQDVRTFPDVIPSLTDLKLKIIEVTQAMGLWGTFDILLVDEDKFSVEYLQSIGQPGY